MCESDMCESDMCESDMCPYQSVYVVTNFRFTSFVCDNS